MKAPCVLGNFTPRRLSQDICINDDGLASRSRGGEKWGGGLVGRWWQLFQLLAACVLLYFCVNVTNCPLAFLPVLT